MNYLVIEFIRDIFTLIHNYSEIYNFPNLKGFVISGAHRVLQVI